MALLAAKREECKPKADSGEGKVQEREDQLAQESVQVEAKPVATVEDQSVNQREDAIESEPEKVTAVVVSAQQPEK